MDSLEDYQQMLRCVLSAMKLRLSDEQIEWLMQKRVRSEYFLKVMNG